MVNFDRERLKALLSRITIVQAATAGCIAGVLLGAGGVWGVTHLTASSGDTVPPAGDTFISEGIDEGDNPGGLSGSAVDEGCTNGVWIEVSGAVAQPGVLCLSDDSIIDDVVGAAGGFSGDACLPWISRNLNLAQHVIPNSKVFVPSVSAVECGAVVGGAVPESVVAAGSGVTEVSASCVSINTASPSELETLPGVGPSTAEKIISGRPYRAVSDLLSVSGIGDKTLDKFKDSICL